jgi:exonuclease VII large subunit
MQRHARHDREWEERPERGTPAETPRRRLRGLFTPSEAADAVVELIAERGKELEERSSQIRQAVEELERREERARELHFRVEQILRDGAAELDLRQADLSVRSAELEARETAVARAGAKVEDRAGRSAPSSFGPRRSSVARRRSGCARSSSSTVRPSWPSWHESSTSWDARSRKQAPAPCVRTSMSSSPHPTGTA